MTDRPLTPLQEFILPSLQTMTQEQLVGVALRYTDVISHLVDGVTHAHNASLTGDVHDVHDALDAVIVGMKAMVTEGRS